MKAIPRPGVLLLVVLFLFSHPLKPTSSATIEAQALLKWRNSLQSSSSLTSWSLTHLRKLCNWTGITCNKDRTVSEINLSDSNLNGTLQQFSFTSFPNLTHFNLNNNHLSGPIPPAIDNLKKLTFLDLSNNVFDNLIPLEIGMLAELQYLSLLNNFLNGTVPHQISNLQKVWYLDLGSNFLETPNWSRFLGMGSLTYLSFSLNELTLGFPGFIPKCRNLTYLDLSQNLFTDLIPESVFTNLGKLEYLDLTHNSFSGPLSLNFTKLSRLRELRLGINKFTGPIPENIGLVSALQIIELHNNSFEGKLPSSIGQLGNLQRIDLRTNSLNSSIPFELGFCSNLTYLALALNSFNGDLPSSLSNLKSIPSSLSDMKSLGSIDFSYNVLSGPIPAGSIFQKAPAEAFLRNSGLCGNAEGLSHCNAASTNGKSKKINSKLVIGIIVPVVSISFLTAVAVCLILRRPSKQQGEETESANDMLDQRLTPPNGELAEGVVFVITLALECTHPKPEARPAMRFVAQELSARTQAMGSLTPRDSLQDRPKPLPVPFARLPTSRKLALML
ncbi:hypothetical protein Acr_26g0009310 [Actinidia rufa]|uniref:Leucine-rich repeat-containing N-terminal plant-type domain-containing protein n=1 Tax=Actinidia rufa TaxID=165716 RepID=A0A7J0H3T4_9ERIC|nr:hypothetical protein Acr_26g0009310 [Actinidia rufa]